MELKLFFNEASIEKMDTKAVAGRAISNFRRLVNLIRYRKLPIHQGCYGIALQNLEISDGYAIPQYLKDADFEQEDRDFLRDFFANITVDPSLAPINPEERLTIHNLVRDDFKCSVGGGLHTAVKATESENAALSFYSTDPWKSQSLDVSLTIESADSQPSTLVPQRLKIVNISSIEYFSLHGNQEPPFLKKLRSTTNKFLEKERFPCANHISQLYWLENSFDSLAAFEEDLRRMGVDDRKAPIIEHGKKIALLYGYSVDSRIKRKNKKNIDKRNTVFSKGGSSNRVYIYFDFQHVKFEFFNHQGINTHEYDFDGNETKVHQEEDGRRKLVL